MALASDLGRRPHGSRRPPQFTTRPMRDPDGLSPGLRFRRALVLLLATVVVPGSAQLAAGDRRLGRIALRAWAVGVAATVLLAALAWLDRGAAIRVLTFPGVLLLVALACWAAAIGWPLLLADAWRLARVRLLPVPQRRWVAALTAVLMVITTLPLLGLGRRAWAANDLIQGVFGDGERADAVGGRYTVLLLGGDAGPSRVGIRPDSITLASVDADTGRTVLFSLPRNLEEVPFPKGSRAARALPEGWSCGDECLLNGLYTWGREHPELFGGVRDSGAEAMKQAVSAVLGIPVNYYVMVDLRGFASMVNAVGGIELTVGRRVPIGGGTSPITGWIEPGRQRLDGYRALWYARSREGSIDYERMARQRCVLSAMADQFEPARVLRRFKQIAAAGKQVVSTDIPASELGRFADLAIKARSQPISSVAFVPPLVRPAYPDFGLIRSRAAAAIAAAEDRPKPDGAPPAEPEPAAEGEAGRPDAKGEAGRPDAKGAAERPEAKGAAERPDAKGAAERPEAKGAAERPAPEREARAQQGPADEPGARGGSDVRRVCAS